MPYHRKHSGIEAGQPKSPPTLATHSFGFRQHLQRGVFEIEYAAEIKRHDIRFHLGDKPLDLLPVMLRVGEENAPLRPYQEQTRKCLVIRMFLETGAEHVGSRL